MSTDLLSPLRRISAWVQKKDAAFFFYLGAQVSSALISLLSIRYVVAFVTREQYGEWGFLGTVSGMLIPLLSLSTPSAMMRWYFDHRDDEVEAQQSLVSTTFVLNAVGALGLVAIVNILHLAGVLSTLRTAFFSLVTTGALAMNFFTYLTRVRNQYVLFFACRMIERTESLLLANCDGVVAANDAMAIGGMQFLKAQGVRIPDDVALVGFDDIDSCLLLEPALSSVHVPKEEMGKLAVQSLVQQIQNKPQTVVTVHVPVELVVRASSGGTSTGATGGAGASLERTVPQQ